jgi:hypothetical protein
MAKNRTKTDTHKKAVLQALEKTFGVVTTACKTVGIARQTFYEWMKEDAAFAEAVKDIENVSLDFAESQLLKQIREDNTTAILFYLKTKGKKRGYVERQEVENSGGLHVTWKEERTYEADAQTD